jgi:hypothetical protein
LLTPKKFLSYQNETNKAAGETEEDRKREKNMEERERERERVRVREILRLRGEYFVKK